MFLFALCLLMGLPACDQTATEPTAMLASLGTQGDPTRPVSLTPKNATLNALGSRLQLSVTVRDKKGKVVTKPRVNWASLDPAVASVNSNGEVTSVRVGTARITATSSGSADTALVQVRQVPARLTVNPLSPTLQQGDTLRLSATLADSNDVAIPDPVLHWHSANGSVASVSAAGTVTGNGAGASAVSASSGAHTSAVQVTVTDQPGSPAGNPFAGETFYVLPSSNNPAKQTRTSWLNAGRTQDAAEISKIADQPWAIWFGGWEGDIHTAVEYWTTRIAGPGRLPVFVAYFIPRRDCGQYSAGGAPSAAAYTQWIDDFARAIGSRKAVVILEPDATALTSCLSSAEHAERFALLSNAVRRFKQNPNTYVYIDAGNARWRSASDIANRLTQANIADADGFVLNISNYLTDQESITYGEAVSARVGGKRFIIDSARNGLGPAPDLAWCNPLGRALGRQPTASTGHPLVDAFFWVKMPGESDGTCNGGPKAGRWWAESADPNHNHGLGLARRAAY